MRGTRTRRGGAAPWIPAMTGPADAATATSSAATTAIVPLSIGWGASGQTALPRTPRPKPAGKSPKLTAAVTQTSAPATSVGLPRRANAPTIRASIAKVTGRTGVTRA